MAFLSVLIFIGAFALPALNRNISSLLFVRISSIIFIYTGLISFNSLYIQSIGSGIGIYSGLFQVTVISNYFEIFISILAGLILFSWPLQNTHNQITIKNIPKIYSVIVLIAVLGQHLLISSSDLLSLYLSIELQSFAAYILASLYRNSESSVSAGLKYFLLGGLSSCIILLGSALIYFLTGLTNLESIYMFITSNENITILQGVSFGFILILIGLLFKISAAPLHNWAPDVYSDTPTIVTIWLTIMPKISIIIFLLELLTQIGLSEYINSSLLNLTINIASGQEVIGLIKNLLLISSLLSLLLGTIVGLAQNRIKRLLAYSTISHIGFILLALSINSEFAIESLIFYLFQYSLTNLNVFLILIAFGISKPSASLDKATGQENDINYLTELKGLFFNNPLLSLSLTICLFSMAGIPPLLGFFSKQFVLYSALQEGYYFMSIVAIITSVISASYYLKIIRILHTPTQEELNSNISNLSNIHTFLISILTLSILLFILKPSLILNSTTILSLSLYNS